MILVSGVLLKMDGNKCPKQWNCPHCNEFYDSEKQSGEEYTVSRSYPNFIPHIKCPKCKKCMGCNETNQ